MGVVWCECGGKKCEKGEKRSNVWGYGGSGDCFFFFKQKTAYEMCGRDWSSDVCSSDRITKGVMALDKHYFIL